MFIHNCEGLKNQEGILIVKRESKNGLIWSIGVFQEDQSDHLFSYVPIKFCCLCGTKLD